MRNSLFGGFLLAFVAILSGCAISPTTAWSSNSPAATGLAGIVHGGQQPVSGASVTLMEPGTTGYGSGATVIVSTTTNSTGGFTLPAYICPANSGLVYLVATGGDSGSGPNSVLVEAALLGPCNLLNSSTFINVSEVTTVAAAYGLAPFAAVSASGTGIGTSATNLQGLTNVFGPVSNLVNAQTGYARAPNEITGVVAPQAEMNTLADILASCVNSTGSTASTAACGMLFAAATPPAGVAPVDTFQAALDIALNPGNNAGTLFGLATASAPYQPTLITTPTDFAVGLQYTGGGINGSYGTQGVAIDVSGNAWVTTGSVIYNYGTTHQLTEITPSGLFPGGSSGFGSTTLAGPMGVAIESTNNFIFVADFEGNQVARFSSSGSFSNTIAATSLDFPYGIAVDTDLSLWLTNGGDPSVAHIQPSGTNITGSPYAITAPAYDIVLNTAGEWFSEYSDSSGVNGYVGNRKAGQSAAVSFPVPGYAQNVALDNGGNIWYATDVSVGGGYVGRWNSSGVSNLTAITVPSPVDPANVFVDGLGNVWVSTFNPVTESSPGALLEYSSTGSLLSPASGLSANGVMSPLPGDPEGMAVDGSGNLWMTGIVIDNNDVFQPTAYVTELIGIAAPVVTPIQAAAKNGTLGARP